MKILTKILLILFLFNNIYFAFGNAETSSTGSLVNTADDHAETSLSNGDIKIEEEIEPELITEEISSDNNVQAEDSSENSNATGEILKDIPTPIIEIQSGLEKGEGDDLYLCKKEICKVNLTVENIFIGDYKASNFTCKWNFGGGTWTTKDTDLKCNPGYVSYSSGEYTISIKITDKNNTENFKESHLKIANHFSSEVDIITNSGTIIDEEIIIDHTADEQGNKISGEDTTGSGIIDTSSSGTGETTGTGEINTGTGVSQETVEEDTSSGITNLIEEEVFKIPQIVFEVQSGIAQNGTGNLYSCKKEDCKVNLTVENLFTGSFNQSDFQCEWTFGTGSFTSGTDKKCNPGYVTYGTGVHEILLRLSEKTHPNNFLTGSIIVLNGIDYDFWLSGTGKILSGSGTESIGSSQTGTLAYNTLSGTTIPKTGAVNTFLSSNTENSTEENFINQSISILTDLQQPSYVTGVGDVFHCDQSKQECKVNFNFTVLENLEKTTSYTCQIQTSIDSKMLESCNPATMIFSNTQNSVYIGIHDKETHNLVYEKEISIINNGYINPRTSKNASVETKEIAKKLTIRLSEIEIQSGLDADNLCKKSDCKVNLKYIEKKGEKCEWNFPKGEYDNKTRFKCNPGYIKYEKYGEYEIELKVYDKNHKNNFKIQKLRFSNIPETAKNKENAIINEQENPEKSHIDYINFDTDFAIDLQGRKSKNKVFSGSIIFCYAEPCNINLDGSNSVRSNGEKIELYWELGENTFEGNNPKALWFNSGSHLISIKDGENTKNITLIVDKNANTFGLLQEKKDTTVIEKIDQIEIDQNILDYLKISAVLPNPHGIDNNEYIEIKNTGKFSINLLGVALDDILDGGSKKFIIDKTIILPAGEKIKWYKYDTKINLNNNQDNVHLSYNNTIIDSLSWDYNLADNYIITHQNSDIGSQEVQIMRIIDGDTIEIKLENGEIEKLRLIGVDTPEVYNSANTLELQYGKIASAYTKNMLLGKTLKLEIESGNFRDAYGRLLGYIYLENGELFNENLIRNGYSRAYLVYNFKYSKNFKSAETKAKKENLIIWGNAEYKKIVNKIIKNDKIAIEESEKHKDKLTAEAFYIDSDDNKIPDSFQISLINNENIIYSTGGMERYNIFIQNSFHINISQLNAGIKVSGKTISNAQLTFKISDRMYSTITDNSGKFSLNIGSDFLASEYTVNSYIIDVYGNNFRLEKIKEFKITKEYLQKLANIEKEKLEKESVKKAKALARERKKIEKRKIAAKGKIYSSIFIKQTQAYNENTSIGSIVPTHKNILTFLIIILSLLMSFFILKRKKLL